ncbi:rhodanese-like domain-containing protein [Nocardia terpenica]|uniref:rhodanese-like domain-containing protein n=1 Tax=Nocardia terpenica TaxID=455432 RepID=UPI001E48189F|nr:rhodanese-like domain-containing protein [Nocardia terpenica]
MNTAPIQPEELPVVLARGGWVIDIRPQAERTRDGALLGALAIERELLTARLDPTSAARLAWARDWDLEWVIMCSSGADSAVDARSLRRLGLARATSLSGGYRALRAAKMLGVADHAAHIEHTVACAFGGIVPERTPTSR